MLDNEHRITCIDKTLKHLDKLLDIRHMESRRRLVEDIYGLARGALCKLGGKLDTLCLTARKRCRGLTYLDVTESYVKERLKLACKTRQMREELKSLLDSHIEHVRDILALIFDLKRVAVVTLALTSIAGNVNIGQKVHLDALNAVALTRLTASALHVERKASRRVAAHFRIGSFSEKLANIGKQPRVRRGIGARCAPYRALVDSDDLIEVLDALNALMLTGIGVCAVKLVRKHLIEYRVYERGFARTRHARNAAEKSERYLYIYPFKVVLLCSDNL